MLTACWVCKIYYCICIVRRRGPGVTCDQRQENKASRANLPALCTRYTWASQCPDLLSFTASWCLDSRDKRGETRWRQSRGFPGKQYLTFGLVYCLFLGHIHALVLERGCTAGLATKDRRWEGAGPPCSQGALLQMKVTHPGAEPQSMQPTWNLWGGMLTPCSSGAQVSQVTCPHLVPQPALQSHMISTQNFPKLLLHLPAQVVHRKNSDRTNI